MSHLVTREALLDSTYGSSGKLSSSMSVASKRMPGQSIDMGPVPSRMERGGDSAFTLDGAIANPKKRRKRKGRGKGTKKKTQGSDVTNPRPVKGSPSSERFSPYDPPPLYQRGSSLDSTSFLSVRSDKGGQPGVSANRKPTDTSPREFLESDPNNRGSARSSKTPVINSSPFRSSFSNAETQKQSSTLKSTFAFSSLQKVTKNKGKENLARKKKMLAFPAINSKFSSHGVTLSGYIEQYKQEPHGQQHQLHGLPVPSFSDEENQTPKRKRVGCCPFTTVALVAFLLVLSFVSYRL